MGDGSLVIIGGGCWVIGLLVAVITAVTSGQQAKSMELIPSMSTYTVGGIIAIAFFVIGGIILFIGRQ